MNKEQRGIEAERIISSPLVLEVLGDIRKDCYKAIEDSAFFQKKNREEAYKMLRTLKSFEGKLKRISDAGKIAGNKKLSKVC